MPARVVAFSSAKGGSGKTVACASFARALAALNQRVLVVDADGDTSGMTLLFIDEILTAKEQKGEGQQPRRNMGGGLFEADKAGSFRVAPVATNVDLLPTQYELASWARSDDQTEMRLRDVIHRVSSQYDYVLLDAQAGADPAALAAATNADDVIIVSEYDPISAQGVKRLEQLYPNVFSSDRTWILYNKVLPDIAESLGTLLRVEKRLNPIPWDADVVRSYVSNAVAINMDVPNPFTLAIVASIETLFGRQIGDKLAEWRSATAAALRAPIVERVKMLEHDLDELERKRIELRTSADYYSRAQRLAAVLAVLIVFGVVTAGVVVTSAGASRWAVITVLISALVVVFAAAPTVLLRRSARESEAEFELSRLERQATYLSDELRNLAVSSSSVAASVGVNPDG